MTSSFCSSPNNCRAEGRLQQPKNNKYPNLPFRGGHRTKSTKFLSYQQKEFTSSAVKAADQLWYNRVYELTKKQQVSISIV